MRLFRQELNRPKSVPSTRGFTLVEVLCAIAIGAISIAALYTSFSNGYAILRLSRDDMRATQILTQKTEAIRLMTWGNLATCPTSFQEYYYPLGTNNNTAGTVYFVTISPYGDPTNIPSSVSYRTNIHLVTITVLWTNNINSKLVPHTRSMQTLLAVQGMQSYLYGLVN